MEMEKEIILDSIADGVFTVDHNWCVTSFNKAAERITGVSRQEALGKRCKEVLKADVCEKGCVLKKTMLSGQSIVNRTVNIVTASGRRIPISISTALLKDKEGRIVGAVETFRDLSVEETLRKKIQNRYFLEDIISKNHRMQRLFDILPDVAESSATVLLEGESGTGKELFARAIHQLSPRRKQPFVAVNCGALPDTLLESELFGYKAGAFTDAKKDKPGRFQLAEGGTLFLDEIGDVSPAMQVRLLRVLQERVYEPLGAVKSVRADVRIIAATKCRLEDLVREGRFREDLYYRINVIKLELPPLRERPEDIPLLADHFIHHFNILQNKNITGLSEDALACLVSHNYPGNVRELENIIEHAFILCKYGPIERHHLPEYLLVAPKLGTAADAPNLRDLEALVVTNALRSRNWNRQSAAKALGIHRSTLYRKIRELRIEIPVPQKRGRPAAKKKEVDP